MKQFSLTLGGLAIGTMLVVAVSILTKEQGTEVWQQIQSKVLPQLVPSDHKEKLSIVHKPLSTTIDIAYVINKLETYDFIVEDDLTAWEIDQKLLEKTAMKNLEKLAENTPMNKASAGSNPFDTYIILEIDDGFAAVRILSERIRKTVAKELGSPAIAAIPTRDFLIFWHEKFSLQQKFADQVQLEFDEGGTYKLSPNVFAVSPEAIGMLQLNEPRK